MSELNLALWFVERFVGPQIALQPKPIWNMSVMAQSGSAAALEVSGTLI